MNVEPIFCATLPASLAPAWGRLLEHSHRPTFQYEFDYMAAWTELLRRDWKPLLLFEKLDGLLTSPQAQQQQSGDKIYLKQAAR